ncbi:hypothetical protein H8356DRAFT_1035133 [Neocallimastix lanati (nom. inval.)]|uniref:Uncharacterized protein n=1 Tax=Neocallimastix californiae TaxID=1754190 RepID=A0A1Y1Z344_9FUNG|nr:hypothetical protein H8356DRAFT_1035133 [Neocallimastix sp. JGI-2020a]ORY04534.1 hypothetical protein LY90DRAFT_639817 [Neocallimastix californiae]|eukprot:ORY04534.1 hypothetical protein LY90DRAFT_639817 [Neocallimastix californiae]
MTIENLIFNETRYESDTPSINDGENVNQKKEVLDNLIMQIETNKSKAYKLMDCISDHISRDQNEIERFLEKNPDMQSIYHNFDFKKLGFLEMKEYQEKPILNHLNESIEKYSFLFENENELNFYKSQDDIINKVNVIFKLIEILYKQKDDLTKEIKDIKSRETQLKNDNVNLKNENNYLKIENKNKETKLESLVNDNEKLKETNSFNELKIKELENKNIIIERENKNKQSYQLKYEKADKERKNLEKQNNELNETLNDLKHNESKLIKENINLVEKVKKLGKRISFYKMVTYKVLLNEKKYLETKEELSSTIKRNGEKIAKLESKIKSYKKKIEKKSPIIKNENYAFNENNEKPS